MNRKIPCRHRACRGIGSVALRRLRCAWHAGGASSGKQANLASPTTKSGTLSIITKFADPKYAPYFVEMANAYDAANPGVKVDLQQVGDQPYKDKIRVPRPPRACPTSTSPGPVTSRTSSSAAASRPT